MSGTPLVRVAALRKYFAVKGGWLGGRRGQVHAVDDVSFDVAAGETLGLVGESGCGKSTLARCIVRLVEPDQGKLEFDGEDITHRPTRSLRPLRRQIQLIFQDPFASLNPRKRISQIIGAALDLRDASISRGDRQAEIARLLERVGLAPQFMDRRPRELSGGQRQRVGIARALAVGPRLIVADEPVSALDVSVQADILNLLKDLQAEFGLTVIFISHDLGVIRHVSDRVGVMYLGRLVELAPADQFYAAPLHPYSEALLSAIPMPDPDAHLTRKEIVLEGDIPSPLAPPKGCRFHTRCPYAQAVCAGSEPTLSTQAGGRLVACHFPLAKQESTGR
ncbi:ABC transporter ATP-binding protein [Aestuariivirga sp. YIM B02566]|uniref:ATP-binding cassette domain-containing protein n=1 Tax=Taklimakanibacter albus TaxID=2800327 RepID=A0ACC5RB55_9HYPH|nr:oligopeptide/dipeptide ABC transporter ATP-binding protein [Aestuariivirga sp. YIM B02566]MBK1869710.1 ATP-binding cassette domain-containing protein [Aestuariivirga sp. YIM B02566]